MYRTIFFGTPDFAVAPLNALIADPRFDVTLVVSQPDKAVGRKQIVTPTPVKQAALEHSIAVEQPLKIRTADFAERLRTEQPDFIVVVAYGRIIPKEILDIPRYGTINIHGSILPAYRGAAPVQASLLHGYKETGVTIMLMSEGLDEGDILHVEKTPIEAKETTATLLSRLSLLGATVLPGALDRFAKGDITPIPQDHSSATFCGKISKEMGEISFIKDTAEEIFKKWQAFTPWPGIYTFANGKRIKLLNLTVSTAKISVPAGHVIYDETVQSFVIGTKENAIFLHELQEEGKKAQTAKEFRNGNKELSNFS